MFKGGGAVCFSVREISVELLNAGALGFAFWEALTTDSFLAWSFADR